MRTLRRLWGRFAAPLSSTARTGRRGERCAVRALRRQGYRIVGRNIRTPAAEIDVLALDQEVLVVVEVKASGRGSTDDRGRPSNPVRTGQIRRLRAASRYLARCRAYAGRRVRRDLVRVTFEGRRPSVSIHRDCF